MAVVYRVTRSNCKKLKKSNLIYNLQFLSLECPSVSPEPQIWPEPEPELLTGSGTTSKTNIF